MKLYHNPASPYTRKVTVMAQEEIATGKVEQYDPEVDAGDAPMDEEEEE